MGKQAEVGYSHQRLEKRRWVLRWMIQNIGYRFLAKFDSVQGLEFFPSSGPAILMINHIAFIDPVVVLSCLPRNVVPMAKREVFRIPLWGIFPWLWDVISVSRGEVDRRALRKALAILKAGEVVLLAPEGTRSPALQRGREGVAYLGGKTGAPVIPVAVEGTENFPMITPAQRRRSGARVKLGRPFRYRQSEGRIDRRMLRKMTDEALYILARMLPPERRGEYADLDSATQDTLDFA